MGKDLHVQRDVQQALEIHMMETNNQEIHMMHVVAVNNI
jgi:hypothetical protein